MACTCRLVASLVFYWTTIVCLLADEIVGSSYLPFLSTFLFTFVFVCCMCARRSNHSHTKPYICPV